MDPITAGWAYFAITLANILITKGPEAYFNIVNSLQQTDPTLQDFEALLAKAKSPEEL